MLAQLNGPIRWTLWHASALEQGYSCRYGSPCGKMESHRGRLDLNGTSPAGSIAVRLNLIWTLMWHRFVPRNNREGMILFWVFVEPAAQLGLLLVLFSLVGRTAGYGTSFALFLLTGIATLNVYTHTSNGVKLTVNRMGSPRRLATVGLFTPALAVLGFHLTIGIVSTLALGYGVVRWQHLSGVAIDFLACGEAFVLAALLGLGVGLVRGYSMLFLPIVERIYTIASRVLLFVSGVFYVPSFLPPVYRDLLAWNPVLHAIDWLRTGVYPRYPELILSYGFLVSCVLCSVALGFALIWHNRRRILR